PGADGRQRRDAVRHQVGPLSEADAGDKGEMIVIPPSLVAALPPATDIAVLDGLGVCFCQTPLRPYWQRPEHLSAHHPEICGIVCETISLDGKILPGGDDEKTFRRESLYLAQQVGIDC